MSFETEIVDAQLEGVKFDEGCVVCEHGLHWHSDDFDADDARHDEGCKHMDCDCERYQKNCRADLDSPCECKDCQRAEDESKADAMATYRAKKTDGDEHPEDGTCDDYLCGCHDDCDSRDCEVCFDRALDVAERMAEGDER